MQAAVPLQDWQKHYLADKSRWKLLVKSVQIGGSFIASLEEVMRRVEKRGLSIMLSASDRQSKELMEKVKTHTDAMGVVAEQSTGFFSQTDIIEHRASFPNGSRIIALPANPDTARGYSGDVLLDEFAIHRDALKIWAAMIGRATRGYDVRVLSSFKGTDNKFYELAKECHLHEGIEPPSCPVMGGVWSGHWCDIYKAKREGLAVDPEEIRQAIGDEEIFQQEYCCLPMTGAEEFIPLPLVMGCESTEASSDFDYEPRPDLYAGMDIGRKKDLSVIWILEKLGDVLVTRGLIRLDRMPFSDQKTAARLVAQCVQKFQIDETGIGMMLAEELQQEFPAIVEPVSFSKRDPQGTPVKERLAVETKRQFEERTLRIPEDRTIRRSIQSVKRYITSTGNMRFDANHTEQGHADEFWALALAISASSTQGYIPASDCEIETRTTLGNLMEAVF